MKQVIIQIDNKQEMFEALQARDQYLYISRESAVNIALSMYAGEPCRVCGEEITMKDLNEGAVFADYSKCNRSRAAHKKCWEQNKPMSEWVYDR